MQKDNGSLIFSAMVGDRRRADGWVDKPNRSLLIDIPEPYKHIVAIQAEDFQCLEAFF